jgi:hypothetical protein
MIRLTEWFATLATPNKAVMILVAIGLLVIAGVTALHVVDTLTETAEQKGVVTERAATQGKVIENVKAAKDAGDHYRADPAQRDAGCLLDATAPEDC